jgi:hypothetical protein
MENIERYEGFNTVEESGDQGSGPDSSEQVKK